MRRINRREFIGTAVAAVGALALGTPGPAAASAMTGRTGGRSARPGDNQVTLGRTGITTSLVGLGTGTRGWDHRSAQTQLGPEAFKRIVRHAFDSGIRFFDCADMYGSHAYLRAALKGLPREQFVLQTKSVSRDEAGIRADLDRFRLELDTDVLDIVLIHCAVSGDWNVRWQSAKEALAGAKEKGIIRAHGVSCHSLEALETAAADPWVEVDLARFNPWGRVMDNRPGELPEKAPGYVKPVLARMRQAGKAVIGMKIAAEGQMMKGPDRLERLRESIRFSLTSRAVDSFVIGVESPEQLDEILAETRTVQADIAAGQG